MQDQSAQIHNVDYQQELAATLVANQGLEGAIRSCQELGWEGVLDRLKVGAAGQVRATAERRLRAG